MHQLFRGDCSGRGWEDETIRFDRARDYRRARRCRLRRHEPAAPDAVPTAADAAAQATTLAVAAPFHATDGGSAVEHDLEFVTFAEMVGQAHTQCGQLIEQKGALPLCMYDENAISIEYGSDDSLGARRTSEFVSGLDDRAPRSVTLRFRTRRSATTARCLPYNAGFQTGRGLNTTVLRGVCGIAGQTMEDAVLPGH